MVNKRRALPQQQEQQKQQKPKQLQVDDKNEDDSSRIDGGRRIIAEAPSLLPATANGPTHDHDSSRSSRSRRRISPSPSTILLSALAVVIFGMQSTTDSPAATVTTQSSHNEQMEAKGQHDRHVFDRSRPQQDQRQNIHTYEEVSASPLSSALPSFARHTDEKTVGDGKDIVSGSPVVQAQVQSPEGGVSVAVAAERISQQSSTTLTVKEEPSRLSSSRPRLVFHMIWTRGVIEYGTHSYAPQIALETICYHHGNTTFQDMLTMNLYILDEITVDARLVDQLNQAGCNIQLHTLPRKEWTSYFTGTPLQDWVHRNRARLENGKYWYSHLTDLFRLTVLWREGGWFVDTDVVWVRPVTVAEAQPPKSSTPTVRQISTNKPTPRFTNSLVNSGRHITNAISSFEARHPYLEAVMRHLQSNYSPRNYISIVQSVSDVAKDWSNKCDAWDNDKRNTTSKLTVGPAPLSTTVTVEDGKNDQDCLTILPRHTCYPFSEYRCRMLFEPATKLTERKIFNNPGGTVFAVHYYSSVNAQQVMHPNSTLYQIYYDSCIICNLPTTSSEDATASASTSATVAVTDTTADLPYTQLQLAEENAAATRKSNIHTTSAMTSTSG